MNESKSMTLKIAVQMDPMETVNIAGDSSFALMLAAQKRGHEIFHYDVKGLTLHANGRLTTPAHPVTVRPVLGNHYTFGHPLKLDLGSDVDVVLMRQDPPFHVGYITATHLLERIEGETLVVNNPVSVRNAPEKVYVLDYAQYMPPTLKMAAISAPCSRYSTRPGRNRIWSSHSSPKCIRATSASC